MQGKGPQERQLHPRQQLLGKGDVEQSGGVLKSTARPMLLELPMPCHAIPPAQYTVSRSCLHPVGAGAASCSVTYDPPKAGYRSAVCMQEQRASPSLRPACAGEEKTFYFLDGNIFCKRSHYWKRCYFSTHKLFPPLPYCFPSCGLFPAPLSPPQDQSWDSLPRVAEPQPWISGRTPCSCL